MRFPATLRLEVERKFAALTQYPLRIDGGKPPFLNLEHLGRSKFQDIYYDHDERLSRAGTWVRQRDGRWQIKIARGGNYTDSKFEESTNVDTISAHVRTLTGLDGAATRAFGLSRIATLTTFRESWKADDDFKIVFDSTDFGHEVGEVELETDVTVQNEHEVTEAMEQMDNRVAHFLQHYAWAFSKDKPVGKLTAYFAQKTKLETKTKNGHLHAT